jgi:hypothetical protein
MAITWNFYDELATFVLQGNVDRGAQWLDEYDPTWYNRINIDWLELSNGADCICGQLFIDNLLDENGWQIYDDGYDYATSELMSQSEAYQYGFRCGTSEVLPYGDTTFEKCVYFSDPYKQYDFLGTVWVGKIRDRRFADIVAKYDFDSYFVTV